MGGSQHTWWGAIIAQDFKRVKEYVDNGQDVDEMNPVLWNANAIFLAQEFGTNRIASYLLSKGGTVAVRNCHNVDGRLHRRVRAGVPDVSGPPRADELDTIFLEHVGECSCRNN